MDRLGKMGWVDRLRGTALLTLGSTDEATLRGAAQRIDRRRTANLLLAGLCGNAEAARALPASRDEELLAAAAGLIEPPSPPLDHPTPAPLLPRSPDDGIEVWTESELTSVHAAWSLPAWRSAAERSARWLIDSIQPDNATNLPWAVHVFASLAVRDGSAEAAMYAETLLHNAIVGRGRPTELGALIVLDAARRLAAEAAI